MVCSRALHLSGLLKCVGVVVSYEFMAQSLRGCQVATHSSLDCNRSLPKPYHTILIRKAEMQGFQNSITTSPIHHAYHSCHVIVYDWQDACSNISTRYSLID